MNEIIFDAYTKLLQGDPSPVENNMLFVAINNIATSLLNEEINDSNSNILDTLLRVCNIIYNNMPIDDDDLFLDNGVYDLLLEKYRSYNPNVQVGAEPIIFNYVPTPRFTKRNTIQLVTRYTKPDFYPDVLIPYPPINKSTIANPLVSRIGYETGKKLRLSSHERPELVGTLDKCKFVLTSQAKALEVDNDPKVKILERDFFGDQIMKGLITSDSILSMIASLKYDGMSIVVSIKNQIVIRAISRGDTGLDVAVDYTPIFYGYMFPDVPPAFELDVKCEAVMTYKDLYTYSDIKGYQYKNPRAAIIGICGSNDGHLYRDLITLVPLKAICTNDINDSRFDVQELNLLLSDRNLEVEFINSFLVNKEFFRTVLLKGNTTTLLYQINKFVEEAKEMRPYMPTMYDGIVLEYIDHNMITLLGRDRSVNRWQIAVKFPTLKRVTKLLAITYTVGQNGVITPMAHYQPIEFLGTVHTKSSISSVARFNQAKFKIGDNIEVEYINDVIPYVSPIIGDSQNITNKNPVLQFITTCPECGTELIMSEKSATCPNHDCPGRKVSRMANMMDKLNIKGFAEETMKKLNVSSLEELCKLSLSDIGDRIHSMVLGDQLRNTLDNIMKTPIEDFILIGALGFSNLAQSTWQMILENYTIIEILLMNDLTKLLAIKGIGPATIEILQQELPLFKRDIDFVLDNFNIIDSKGSGNKKKIRVTGFRDPDLMLKLRQMGYDASDKGVTKDTFILLIPYEGFSSSKLKKIGPDTKVIDVNLFKEKMDHFLQ